MSNHLFDAIRSSAEAGGIFIEIPNGRQWTYADMLSLSGRLAGTLETLGVKPGDRVAVQVEKSPEALMLYLACLRAGAVYLPALDELYTASEGGGAQLNGTPLAGPAETTLASALVATGFGYTVERRTEQAEVVRRLIPRVRDIRRIGSAAADLCFLAAGRLDAYYERGLQPWDYAAGALIARESGALLLGRGDDAPGEPMLIAAAPRLARVLHTEIEAAYAAG